MSEMTGQEVIIKCNEANIAYITLNRPYAYNALSSELMAELQATLDHISIDHSIKVVVLSGAGKGFCAGHDLKELKGKNNIEFHSQIFDQCSKLMKSIVRLPQPVIASVHGIATAAGCQLVASCDLAVASETATFGTPGVNIGLFCSTPMVAVSRKIPRKQVMAMLLTGEHISAAKAVDTGLINESVPLETLPTRTKELALQIASKSPKVLAIGKEAFYRQIEMPLDEAYDYTSAVMVKNMQLADADEGIAAFIDKRTPMWQQS